MAAQKFYHNISICDASALIREYLLKTTKFTTKW